MDSNNTNGGRETAPFSTPANSTVSGENNTRARVCVLLPKFEAHVAIRVSGRCFSIPLGALPSLLDELTEAHRIACEHGLIVEAANGAS